VAASVRRVSRKSPVIQIQRVTIIAFYTPARRAANVDADSNEALSGEDIVFRPKSDVVE
jgi:hypothetical protein